ncbi:MAG: hypothetical protein CMM73_05110 [Rhodospirillaceae bacterium]|nr:hypothetical protein [Rhodospirillaceae bacterium]
MRDKLATLIDWESHPRRIVASGSSIIIAGDPTDLLHLLDKGQAKAADGVMCLVGDLMLVCEALALTHYRTPVIAESACEVITLPQRLLQKSLADGSAIVWPLSRSIAAELTQRRLAS